jgi:2-C-methyl-D-erythritol 4-phosphate cytidylyltransferase
VSTPSLKVVVAITSSIAFQELKNQSILQTCLDTCAEFTSQYGPNVHLAIAGTEEALLEIVELDCEKIQCDPNSAQELTNSLKTAQAFELLMIHDSQRALTTVAQFHRVLQALTPNIDAVRPVSAFTETLKSIGADHYIEGTIDRNSMMRTSTPELIRFSAIDFQGTTSTWFVPIKADAKITTVDADPESARINSEFEINLMKHLLNGN